MCQCIRHLLNQLKCTTKSTKLIGILYCQLYAMLQQDAMTCGIQASQSGESWNSVTQPDRAAGSAFKIIQTHADYSGTSICRVRALGARPCVRALGARCVCATCWSSYAPRTLSPTITGLCGGTTWPHQTQALCVGLTRNQAPVCAHASVWANVAGSYRVLHRVDVVCHCGTVCDFV